MSWPTTRRYPRTLGEAFPADPTWACAVEVHRQPIRTIERIAGFLLAVAIGVTLALIVWGAL